MALRFAAPLARAAKTTALGARAVQRNMVSASISIFHCQKVTGSKLKKMPFGSQTLRAVTLLSYNMPMQSKRGAEVLHGKIATSSAWQCLYKPCCAGLLGFKCCWMLWWPLQNGLKFTLIKGGILGTMNSFSLEVITRDAIPMKIILLFQASANNWVSNPEQYITLPSYPKSSPSFLLPFSHPTNLIQALLLQNIILQCVLELELQERKHFKVPCKSDQMISSQDRERFQGLLRELTMN